MPKFIFIFLLFHFKATHGQTDSTKSKTEIYFIKKALELGSEKKYEKALIFIDSAIAIDSNNTSTFAIKAELLWMTKNFSQAALIYQKALVLDKDGSYLFGAYLFLGVLYEKANMRVQAQAQYLKAIYFFETKKRKDDKYFAVPNKIDYAIALKLSGNEKAWEKVFDDPIYQSLKEVYFGRSREEVLELFFKPFSGD